MTYETPKDDWEQWRLSYGITDLSRFACVGHIHNFGYIGALLGMIAAALLTKRDARRHAGITRERLSTEQTAAGGGE